jgi:O-antigen ligase
MSELGALSVNGPARPAPARVPPHIARASAWQQFAVDALCVVFLVGATSAVHSFGIDRVERFFWLPADLALVLLFVPRNDPLIYFVRRHAILIAWPLLACISAAWSLAPFESVYHGVQLLTTILVGFLLCMYAGLARTLVLVFVALLICQFLSVGIEFLRHGTAIRPGDTWQGVFPHKNVFGSLMGTQIIIGVCLYLQGWRPKLTLAAIGSAFVLLYMSKSGTALLATFAALAVVPVAIAYYRSRTMFTLAAAMLGMFVILVAFVVASLNISLTELTLTSLGKESTLTGRTVLWNIGLDAFYSKPWFGFGFKGYWMSEETTMRFLRYMVGQELWFFHNNYLEVMVGLGIVGLVIFVLGLLVSISRTVRAFAIQPQPVLLAPVLVVVFIITLCFAENPLFSNHSFLQMLFVAMVAGATTRLDFSSRSGADTPRISSREAEPIRKAKFANG